MVGSRGDDDVETVARARPPSPTMRAPTFVVTVIEGPDVGRRLVIDGEAGTRVLVGQSPACALQLTDPQVSRRHAAFELEGARLRLLDLGSTNGTAANGLAVTDVFLEGGGERIHLGETTLRVDRGEARTNIELPSATSFGRMTGASPEMRRLYPLCERLAKTSVPVIVEGETGTGKEVLAESLHARGPRANAPFIVFDCTAVPENLMESALFGHEKGAFTGATSVRRGVFERAHGGTLLIDEIGDLGLALQPKLLRAIERGEVQRVGGDRWIKVDVRVIAATRRDLDREIQEGRFRDDLFFRLAIARIELPPLRRRTGDVGVLTRKFWADLGGDPGAFPYALIAQFEKYAWPGNVRELHNAVMRHVALGEVSIEDDPSNPGDVGEVAVAHDPVAEVLAERLPFPRARDRVLHAFERRYVEQVLGEHGGNVGKAAAASGIALRYFQMIRARHR